MNKFDPAAYITSLNIDVMRFGLTAISELLSRLGNPQKFLSDNPDCGHQREGVDGGDDRFDAAGGWL